jgi:formyltetrahydrofolate-dependent phosphoribosylglycinamide formyltransferase
MFQRLKQKWKVNGLQLALIIITFAIGGSLTGYAGRKLLNLFAIEKNWLWILIYILLICLLWPPAVLLVSIPFGQYRFFNRYIKKIGKRIGLGSRQSIKIAIFASGTGSNAQKIIDYFKNQGKEVRVELIACNNPTAGVLQIAAKENIPTLIIEKEKFFRGNAYIHELKGKQIDLIVLAGFMWKIPDALIKAYPNRIINIHPALLPKYGGKGLYGNYVHETVLANKEKESGISIHYVDEIYDHGKIIFQAKCTVMENDTADSLAQRIHALEHEHYPKVIEEVIRQINHTNR